jgi:hypothetical protein
MRFVEMKTREQLDLQTLRGSSERLVGEQTALINQLHGILLERGIVVPQGAFPNFISRSQNERALARRSRALIHYGQLSRAML